MTLFEHEMVGGDDGNRTRVRGFADRTSGSDAYRSVPTSEASEAEMSDAYRSVPMRTDAVNGHKWSRETTMTDLPPFSHQGFTDLLKQLSGDAWPIGWPRRTERTGTDGRHPTPRQQ